MYAEVLDLHQQFLAMRTMQDCSYAEAVAFSSGVVAFHRESEFMQAIAHHEGLGEKGLLFFLVRDLHVFFCSRAFDWVGFS